MLLAVTGDPVVARRGSGCSRGAVGHGGLGPELLTGGLNLSGSLRRSLPDQVGPLLHLLLLQLGGRWLSRPRRAGARMQSVVDLDDGGVVDQVQALEVDAAHVGAEQVLELGDELVLVADGPVEGDDLVAVAAHECRVVTHPQRGEDEGHEDGDDDEVGLDAAEQAQGQGREEVGHLPLGQGGGAQADDGQDTEEPQAQSGPDVVARRQQQGDRQDTHVDADVGGHQVSAPVARNVESSD